MRSLVEIAAVALLLTNAGFLLGVFGKLALSWDAWTAPAPAQAAASATDPGVHLPLAGMAGFSGSPDVACLSLEGFLLDLGAALVERGAQPPMDQPAIRALAGQGDCRVDAPQVAEALERYSEAWAAAGLAPIGPLQ